MARNDNVDNHHRNNTKLPYLASWYKLYRTTTIEKVKWQGPNAFQLTFIYFANLSALFFTLRIILFVKDLVVHDHHIVVIMIIDEVRRNYINHCTDDHTIK